MAVWTENVATRPSLAIPAKSAPSLLPPGLWARSEQLKAAGTGPDELGV